MKVLIEITEDIYLGKQLLYKKGSQHKAERAECLTGWWILHDMLGSVRVFGDEAKEVEE